MDIHEQEEYHNLHAAASLCVKLQGVLKLEYTVICQDVQQLLKHEYRQYLTGGLPTKFMFLVNQRRAQLESADNNHQTWAETINLMGNRGTWRVDSASFLDTMELMQPDDHEAFLTAWLASVFPDVIFRCLSATDVQQGGVCAVELALIANLALEALPEEGPGLTNLHHDLRVPVQSVTVAMDGLRGLSEPFPGVSLEAVNFINPEDIAECDVVRIFPKAGRGIVSRIKRSAFWQDAANLFRRFYSAEVELLEPFEQLEEMLVSASEVFEKYDTMTFELDRRLEADAFVSFVDRWCEIFGHLHDNLRPGACSRLLTDVGKLITKVHGFFGNVVQDLSLLQEDYMLNGMKMLVRMIGAVDACALDMKCAESWQPSADARSKVIWMQKLALREAGSHQLRRLVGQRVAKTWEDITALAKVLANQPAVMHEDQMVARDMASTLLEVWELVSDATAADLEVHHESLCKCVVTMSVTVDDQKWCTLLGSLSTALKAQHDALALAAPTPDADIIASQRHCLDVLKSSRDELVAAVLQIPSQVSDANIVAKMVKFKDGAMTHILRKMLETWLAAAANIVQVSVPLLKSSVHSVKQISRGQSDFKHWGFNCKDVSLEGVVAQYQDKLQPALAQISQSGTRLAQDFVCLSLYLLICRV